MTRNLAVLGVGRIGAVTAVGLAHLGHAVVGIDRSARRLSDLQSGTLPEREPGLQSALRSALRYRDLAFREAGEPGAYDVAFLCVDTPPRASGEPDLSQVLDATASAAPLLRPAGVLVTRSTVPVGTGDRLVAVLERLGRPDIAVVHAPEFLREGHAWEDFREPDRLVFGGDPSASALIAALFASLPCPVFETDRRTAELAKYAANAFLATTISFANEMTDLCGDLGVDAATVFRVLKADQRVGPHAYLAPGLGFGGHCLPKDTAALEHMAAVHGRWMPQLSATRHVNRGRTGAAVAWLRRALGSLDGRRVCMAGLAFKAGTDDLRESPALQLADALHLEGVSLTGCDAGIDPGIPYIACHARVEDAVAGADAIVFTHSGSEWSLLDPARLAAAMPGRVVFDAPGILDVDRWRAEGFHLNRPAPHRRVWSAPAGERT